MQKWQRNYEAVFDIGHYDDNNQPVFDKKVTISYPITINLNVSLGALGSPNEAVLQFYNLSPETRATLWQDNFTIGSKVITVTLRAGYGSEMPIIFVGWVQECLSSKDGGATEWVTNIQAFDGGSVYGYGFINSTYIKGASWADIFNDIIKGDSKTHVGYISKDLQTLEADKTFIGQPMDLLKREFDGYQVFINNGELNILSDNEVVPSQIPVLTDFSGLLGSPKRSNIFVEVEMLFEPQLIIGQAIALKSKLMPEFNQDYKVQQITHTGVISDVVSGTLTTSMVLTSAKDLEVLSRAELTQYTGQVDPTNWLKPAQGRITSRFGRRTRPIADATTEHMGIDIGADYNSPVVAPADGTVIMAQYYGSAGKCIKIDHGTINGVRVTSLYGHLNSYNVQAKQVVYRGQTIGYVGSTGVSTGPHLHFGILENGKYINPLKYIGSY